MDIISRFAELVKRAFYKANEKLSLANGVFARESSFYIRLFRGFDHRCAGQAVI